MARGRGPRARRPRIDVAREGVRGMSDAAVVRAASATISAVRTGIGALSITFLSVSAMRRLNAKHLGRSGLTDVIAFSLTDQGALAGDVYISPDAARLSAREHRVSMREELTRLVVHGTLHVLGWDHPEGDRRTRSAMWRTQEAIVAKLMKAPR